MGNQSQEFTGKNVEIAIENGLKQLGLRRDQVEVEVLNEGSRGLFGIGSTDARVRLTPVAPSTEAESVLDKTPDVAPAISPVAETPAETSPVESAESAKPAPADMGETVQSEPEIVETPPVAQAEYEPEDVLELASNLLREMLQHMGIQATVEASWGEASPEQNEPPLMLNIEGGDLGVLIGRHGETLASIQYLVRLMVNQKIHRWTNIIVDVDQYKMRRAERLTQMAVRMADQVVRTGRPAALEPMPPSDRRLIHLALRDHELVYTESVGEGDRRKVQILPK
jgi:spoIIIJ-associated protein